MTRKRSRVPPGLYAPDGSGLLDPTRPTVEDRERKSPARIAAERADATLLSPTIRRLRLVARRALGGR